MESLNLIVLGGFTLLTALLTLCFKKANKWIGLLIGSCLFYFYYLDVRILLPLFIWLLVYVFGKRLENKKGTLKVAIAISLCPLILNKILHRRNHFENYASRNIEAFEIGWVGIFEIVGISYFTFITISYLIDIRRGYIQSEKNPFKLLLYLIYFPTILSGPLHRYKYLSEEFKNIHVSEESIVKGLRILLWGLFKNIVVAPRIFKVFSRLNAGEISGLYLLLVGLLFFLYLYVNFSSFINIFQGISTIFNIRLKDNFRERIYLSNSRQHFWSGWHMTLNEWFRDYFFFPLAKKKKSAAYVNVILLVTFLLIALWHEVSFTMAVWGAMNGLWIVLEKRVPYQKWPFPKVRKHIGVLYHLLIASFLALVFISPSFPKVVKVLFESPNIETTQLGQFNPIVLIICFGVIDWFSLKAKNRSFDNFLSSKSTTFRWASYLTLILMILLFGESSQIDNYYIQF